MDNKADVLLITDGDADRCGTGDENGVRLNLNLETPSLNSMAYTYMECAAG